MDNEQEIGRRLKEAQLVLLKELERVCNELGLQYCVTYGTAIGAIRHKGFIPWDDDIDVHMLWEDLEKLEKNADRFGEGFFLQYPGSEPQYDLMIVRLRNSNTTLVEKTEKDLDINQGIFLDIYPLFNCPEKGKRGFRRELRASRLYRLMLYGRAPEKHGWVMRAGGQALLKLIPQRRRKKVRDKCWKILTEAPKTGFRAALFGHTGEAVSIPEKWLFPPERAPFEDTEVWLGPETGKYLEIMYGDFMQLPPEEKRCFHHDYDCIDFEKPYTEYRGIAYCREQGPWGGSRQDEESVGRRLKEAQRDLLKELDRVCAELGLPWCAAFGTALGTVRHKGFIPWDDDIDVHMLWENLETLQRHPELFREGTFLQHAGSDPEYGLMITRLRNSNTTLVEGTETDRDINHGIFLDIYPLFNCPEPGKPGFRKQLCASRVYRLLLYGRVPRNHGWVMKAGSWVLLKVIPKGWRKSIMAKCHRILAGAPETGYRSVLFGGVEETVRLPESWLFPPETAPFEDGEIRLGPEAEKYLEVMYGDYMRLPPESERHFHHDFACVDFDRPYTEYKGVAYCKERKK